MHFCNTNEGYLTANPHGIVLEVPGLGGGIGGLCSLIYTADSKHTVTACVSACPRIEASSTAYFQPWQIRGLISAIAAYDMPLEDALRTISPLHRLPGCKHGEFTPEVRQQLTHFIIRCAKE